MDYVWLHTLYSVIDGKRQEMTLNDAKTTKEAEKSTTADKPKQDDAKTTKEAEKSTTADKPKQDQPTPMDVESPTHSSSGIFCCFGNRTKKDDVVVS